MRNFLFGIHKYCEEKDLKTEVRLKKVMFHHPKLQIGYLFVFFPKGSLFG